MKLIRCHIDNFGKLHEYDYNFDEGLNIVLQDNCWGKTTLADFLKVMLYGMGDKNAEGESAKERAKYLPWQGGTYGGTLDFESEGKQYRIERKFGETPEDDYSKIIDLSTDMTALIDPETLGEDLFKLDSSAFERSVFIDQNGLSMGDASTGIRTRLNSLIYHANDLAAFDDAIRHLNEEIRDYERPGQKDRLKDLSRAIAEKERQREVLEENIKGQDHAKERISGVRAHLVETEAELAETKENTTKLSGYNQRIASSEKLLADINEQHAGVAGQCEVIRQSLNGVIPEADKLSSMNTKNRHINDLEKSIQELDTTLSNLSEEQTRINDQYSGKLPTVEDLDLVRNAYTELQGFRTTSAQEVIEEPMEPECFALFEELQKNDPEILSKLDQAVDSKDTLQALLIQRAREEEEAKLAKRLREERKSQYKQMLEETKALEQAVTDTNPYEEERSGPIIAKLEELQKDKQIVKLRSEELEHEGIDEDEERLLAKYTEHPFGLAEGERVLQKYRNVQTAASEVKGTTAKLEGENAKAEGIRTALSQFDGVTELSITPVSEPAKSSGTALIILGVLVMIAGAVLAFLIQPAFAALIALGLLLILPGNRMNQKHQEDETAYQEYKAKKEQNDEKLKKKRELEDQLKASEETISSLNKEIDSLKSQVSIEESEVISWSKNWLAGGSISEEAIGAVLEEGRSVGRIRFRKNAYENKKKYVAEVKEEINRLWNESCDAYPEISKNTPEEAAKHLQEKKSDHNRHVDALAKLNDKKTKFLADIGETEEELLSDVVKEIPIPSADQIKALVDEDNAILSNVGIQITDSSFKEEFDTVRTMLADYRLYVQKVKELNERRLQKERHEAELVEKLNETEKVLQGQYADLSIPERLAKSREDISRTVTIEKQLKELTQLRVDAFAKYQGLSESVFSYLKQFTEEPGDFTAELEEIGRKAAEYAPLALQKDHLESQRESLLEDIRKAKEGIASLRVQDEAELRTRLGELEQLRDELRDEYQQKAAHIRNADQSLEKYPDVLNELDELCEEKQDARNAAASLKKTIALITSAKNNLANRYLGRVENLFNEYMKIWLGNDAVRGILDQDFNVSIDEGGEPHSAVEYSTGYSDLIDICMRLALIDTLFEEEQPFLILDDPFVNLDANHLDKALELLKAMSANKQVVYFVCHPIRAVEKMGDSEARRRFRELVEKTRTISAERKATSQEAEAAQSQEDLYHQREETGTPLITPVDPDAMITSPVFNMKLKVREGAEGSASYELFFIDEEGHVLSEKRLAEVNNGRLIADSVQFSLNPAESGSHRVELMIRDSEAADPFEVLERIPLQAQFAA